MKLKPADSPTGSGSRFNEKVHTVRQGFVKRPVLTATAKIGVAVGSECCLGSMILSCFVLVQHRASSIYE